MNSRKPICFVAAVLLTAVTGSAQTSKGTLAGRVTDASDATVANATVTAKDKLGAGSRTVSTNAEGEYRIEAINPSTYTITVTASGFATQMMENVRVEASVVTSLDVKLEVGGVSQTVTVEGSAPTVETATGDLNKSISTREVQTLPIQNLNPISLALTEPGISQPGSREDFTNGTGFSVNGLRPRDNNFLLDGFDNNDSSIAGQALQPQNLEAIQEVTFLTNSYQPEFGRGGASVTNVTYKSGTNQYHGAAWERYSGAALNAITADQHNQGLTTVPNTVENVFGFAVGGPVVKDKLFLFGTSQWDHQNYDESGNQLVIPTAAGVASLQSLGNANANLLVSTLGGLVAPAGTSSVNTINIGNRPGCGSPCLIQVGDVIRTPKALSRSYEYVIRGDFTASEKDNFSARFIGSHNSLTPDLFANPNALPTQDTFQGGPARNLGVFWTHVFSPTMVNEVRFTAQQINFTFDYLGATASGPLAKLPSITISGLNGTYGGPGDLGTWPQGRGHDNFQYQEAFSWTKGSHSFKMGMDFVHLGVTDSLPFNSLGSVTVVAGGDCSAIGLTRCSGLANFIDNFTGPSGNAGRSFGSSILAFPQTMQNYYLQDSWKLFPNLTLTWGLRYEFQGTPFNGLQYPAVNPDTLLTDPYPLRITQKPDRNNFGPRFGFAYTPNFWKGLFGNGKTVLRGGFGAFYDPLFTNIEDNTQGTPPNTLGGTLVSPSTGRGSSGLLSLVSGVTPVLNPKSSINSIPANLVNPLIYQWNFNIQRQLPGSFLATVAYVGTRGERLYLNQELNPGVNGVRIDPARGSILVRGNLGNSSYNGLQLDLERRFSGGLLVRGNYTYSKAIDNGSEVFTIQNSSVAQNPFNYGLERGLSNFDHRQRAAFTWAYDLPYVKGNSGGSRVLRYAMKGWNVSGTVQLQSGSPTVVYTQLDLAGSLRANQRPNAGNPTAPINYSAACLSSTTCITGIGQVNADGSLSDYNTGAAGSFNQFRYIVPLSGFGNLGHNTVENPGTIESSLAVARAFPLPFREGHQLEFRAEAFNPFNHANAGDLTGTIQSPDFLNKDVTFYGGRELRLWLKYRF